MRILHVITSLKLGGAEKLVVDIIKIQREKGFHVDLLVLSNKDNYFFVEDAIMRTNKINKYKSILGIAVLIQNGNYNIVHSHLNQSHRTVALASLLDINIYLSKLLKRKVKRVYLATEYAYNEKNKSKNKDKLVEKIKYSRYKKIVCTSTKTLEDLKKNEQIKKKGHNTLTVIETGIILDRFLYGDPIDRVEIGVLEEDKVLVMVSKLDDSEDHETLFKAMGLLPKKYKLLLIGDGIKKVPLIQLGKELRLGDRIKYLGVQTDVAPIFKASDILIQAPNHEKVSLTVIEAMASGIPVIVADTSELRDIVNDAGIFFKKGDSRELAKKILEIDRCEEIKNELKRKGLERANEYCLHRVVEKYDILYKELLGE